MSRTLIMLAVGCALSVAAIAAPCNQSTWTFDGLAKCSSSNTGVAFTQDGETITIFPEYVENGVIQPPGAQVNGLFEVNGQSPNLASGIGPYVPSQGGSPYTGQLGIQDANYGGNDYDAVLYLEVSQTGPDPIASGTTLQFLMQEGLTADTFNVYTSIGTSTTPPNITKMTEVDDNVAVGATSGGATTPQFSIKTTTTGGDPVEFIAIEADCDYLLLNSITLKTSSVPEPRFYGLLLAGLFGLAGMLYQKWRAARAKA
jgi:hypothetical protein